MTKYVKDLLERTGWTALEAGVGVLAVENFDWAKGWAVPIAFGVAFLKGIVAKHVGNSDSASTVKSV